MLQDPLQVLQIADIPKFRISAS